MVIAGSERTTRRRGVRRQRDPFSRFGAELRQARETAGLTLEAVGDRTGVRRHHLEALEEGDLSRFPDESAALVAVRRYAEIFGLDAAAMAQTVGAQWRTVGDRPSPVLVGATPAAPPPRPDTGPVPAVPGHLSRYPGDTSHLRSFTQTAQVPQVKTPRTVRPSLPPGLRFDSTDAIPVTLRGRPEPRPAPLALRVAVWSTALLLVVGVGGLAVHHWRPAWLRKIHLVEGPPTGGAATSHGPRPPAARGPVVKEAASGPLSATVTVRSSVFSVVVTTAAPCWIHVSSPASFAPVFSATVPAGTTKSFTSSSGQLSVELGASRVSMTVSILGTTVPGFVFAPRAAPFVVNFHSAPT